MQESERVRWKGAIKSWISGLIGYGCLVYLWALCLTGMRFWLLGEPGAETKALLFGWLALGVHILADLWPFNRLRQVWPLVYVYRQSK